MKRSSQPPEYLVIVSGEHEIKSKIGKLKIEDVSKAKIMILNKGTTRLKEESFGVGCGYTTGDTVSNRQGQSHSMICNANHCKDNTTPIDTMRHGYHQVMRPSPFTCSSVRI